MSDKILKLKDREVLDALCFLHSLARENTRYETQEEAFLVVYNYIKELEGKIGEWIPCSERLPITYDNLLICQSDGYVNVGYYSLNEFKDMNSYPYKDVIAWMPLPPAYKGE